MTSPKKARHELPASGAMARRMRGSVVRLLLLAPLVFGVVGCGSVPTTSTPRTKAKAPITAVHNRVAEPEASEDIMKNPFVNWVKNTYPREAAGIINHYLSTYGMDRNNPTTEIERSKLRTQLLDMVSAELLKNLVPAMPKGIAVRRQGRTLKCQGVVDYQGHAIAVSFEFAVYLDREGMVWIDQPAESVKGEISGFDPLARLFGGDIRKKTREEIVRSLNQQGPKNAAKTPGLSYVGAGAFKLNPGVAFVSMPG